MPEINEVFLLTLIEAKRQTLLEINVQGCLFRTLEYISCAVNNFYGTEIEIWAGLGPVGNTEKKIGPIMSNF